MREVFEHPRKSVYAKLPENNVIIKASEAELHRALENLLDNAVKYGDPGTPITVGLNTEEKQIRIWVTTWPRYIGERTIQPLSSFARTKTTEKGRTKDGVWPVPRLCVAVAHSGRAL